MLTAPRRFLCPPGCSCCEKREEDGDHHDEESEEYTPLTQAAVGDGGQHNIYKVADWRLWVTIGLVTVAIGLATWGLVVGFNASGTTTNVYNEGTPLPLIPSTSDPDATWVLVIGANGVPVWQVQTTGHLIGPQGDDGPQGEVGPQGPQGDPAWRSAMRR